ncbi:hypothetical protein ES703_82153 [subsurface metagenome]
MPKVGRLTLPDQVSPTFTCRGRFKAGVPRISIVGTSGTTGGGGVGITGGAISLISSRPGNVLEPTSMPVVESYSSTATE